MFSCSRGGGLESQCNSGNWGDQPPLCEPACPSLTAPDNVQYCNKTLITESFPAGTSLVRFRQLPGVPALVTSQFWNVSATGGFCYTPARIFFS